MARVLNPDQGVLSGAWVFLKNLVDLFHELLDLRFGLSLFYLVGHDSLIVATPCASFAHRVESGRRLPRTALSIAGWPNAVEPSTILKKAVGSGPRLRPSVCPQTHGWCQFAQLIAEPALFRGRCPVKIQDILPSLEGNPQVSWPSGH